MAPRKTSTAKTPKKRTIPASGGKKAITFQQGGLHASLGVPKDKPIPKAKMAAARAGKYGPKAKKQAQFAANVLTGGRGKSAR